MKRTKYMTPLNEEGGDIHPLTSIWTRSNRPSFWLGRPYKSPNDCIVIMNQYSFFHALM